MVSFLALVRVGEGPGNAHRLSLRYHANQLVGSAVMYRCRHFSIDELVPKDIFEARGQLAWELLDSRILKAIDLIRDD